MKALKNSTIRAVTYISVIILCILSVWGCGGEYRNEPANSDVSENRENKSDDEEEKRNPYFPYGSDQEILFDGRFYISDLFEKQTTVYIKRKVRVKGVRYGILLLSGLNMIPTIQMESIRCRLSAWIYTIS